MEPRRLIASLLVALGVVTLLGRMSGGSGWLWIAVVAASFLIAWWREGTYGLLVIGAVLGGMAVGILLEGDLGWDGAFLVGVGAGFLGIDLVAPGRAHWPRLAGAIVVVAGLGLGIAQAGVLGSTWFAVLLVAAGVWLAARRRGGWVHVIAPSGTEAVATDAARSSPTGGAPDASDDARAEGGDAP